VTSKYVSLGVPRHYCSSITGIPQSLKLNSWFHKAKKEIIRIEKQKLEVELRKKERKQKKEEIEKQKLEVELRKEAREQKKEEREIMMMDTSRLSKMQLEYIQSLQMVIIEKRRTK
jgi:hypothetical protein